MEAKKITSIIITIILIVAMIVVAFVVPTKEEKIYSYVENDQFVEASNYVARKGISSLKSNSEKTKAIKDLLFEKYNKLNDDLIDGIISYEICKKSYELGEKLFADDMKTSEGAISLKITLDIFANCENLKKMSDEKDYTKLLNDVATSEFISYDIYISKVSEILSTINNDELYAKLENDIDGSFKTEEFTEIPAFITNESNLINICITHQQVVDLKTKIEASNKSKTCVVSNCGKIKSSDSQYCNNHLCNESGCKNYASKSYCSAHTCVASGCDSGKESGSSYCYSHTCSESDCNRYTSNDYCSAHECVKSGCDNGRSSGSSYCYSHSTTSSSYSGSFTNKYGSSNTICAVSGCSRYIASSGDTNCCTTHSNRCGNCRCYIDGDAMYCMSCLSSAFR